MFRAPIINAQALGLTPAAAKLLQAAFDDISSDIRSVRTAARDTSSYLQTTAGQVVNITNVTSAGGGLLARIPSVDLTATADTQVFEALDGNYIILDVVVRITSASGVAADPGLYVSVGNAAGAANIFGSRKLRGTLAGGVVVALGDWGIRPQIGLGDSVYFNVDMGASATTLVATIDVIGYAI